MEYFGIDVSHENGKIDWAQVKGAGVSFAILRCHQRFGIDLQFKRNYSQCIKKGIPVGAYKYSYAQNVKEAKKEAKDVIAVLEGKKIQFPVFYDLEWDIQKSYSIDTIEAIAEAFLSKVKAAGFKVGIYCNVDWYKNRISNRLKQKYDFWIASYPSDDKGAVKESIRPLCGIGWQYSEMGRVPGISGGHVDLNLFKTNFAEENPMTLEEVKADPVKEEKTVEEYVINRGTSPDDIIQIARAWIGRNEADGSHRGIIDLYNSHKPLARGYAVQYTDSWCDTFVSACFIKADAVSLIGGTECGVDAHIQLFKAEGIWIEDGTTIPKAGDIICYNWDSSVQPNDSFADHIGIVESVNNSGITVIEGNYNNAVGRRNVPFGWGFIRGFARPKYESDAETKQVSPALGKSVDEVATEVIRGLWGNGADRVARLETAGYNAALVQAKVNELLK